jgi:hypothetical protein
MVRLRSRGLRFGSHQEHSQEWLCHTVSVDVLLLRVVTANKCRLERVPSVCFLLFTVISNICHCRLETLLAVVCFAASVAVCIE